MATMEDIAKKLNISKSTVSKGLSGAPDVSETMRKSILETAVELGYNRTMRRGKATRFVVFIENMAYESPEDFGYDIILGFRKMAEPDGSEVVIAADEGVICFDGRYRSPKGSSGKLFYHMVQDFVEGRD